MLLGCSDDVKDLQHLKMSGAIDIAATAMLGISMVSVSLSVDSDVDCYMDLCRGALLSRLKLKDDWILA